MYITVKEREVMEEAKLSIAMWKELQLVERRQSGRPEFMHKVWFKQPTLQALYKRGLVEFDAIEHVHLTAKGIELLLKSTGATYA